MSETHDDVRREPYARFIEDVKRMHHVEEAANVLQWDQEVNMPVGGVKARSSQLSTLSSIQHEILTGEAMGEQLAALDDENLDASQAANVREIRRQYDRQVRVPNELVEELSRTASEAFQDWRRARQDDEFERFSPSLERLVELRRRYAEHVDPDEEPYAVLFADYEPYIELDTAERVLDRLREGLVPMLEAIEASEVDEPGRAVRGDATFPAANQEAACRAILDLVGYDWDRGRLDTAPHPFSTGTPFDARVTTRFDESDPLSAVMSTIHEFGHARYTLGLPTEHYATPLGRARDLTVHESQSRLWENHVGRSRAFWETARPVLLEHLPGLSRWSVDDLYGAVNRVYPNNLIRVEADELTYHLHIVLRFELERELFDGALEVEELPAAWNERMERYLGVRPSSDADGCLQDVHWSHGAFGYFPTYSLGSMLAAQLAASLQEDVPDLDEQVRRGEFDALEGWLSRAVFQHGCRYPTPDLIERATGGPLRATDFLAYVERKFGDIYGI